LHPNLGEGLEIQEIAAAVEVDNYS